MALIVVISILLMTGTNRVLTEEDPESVGNTQCDAAIKQIAEEDLATIIDDSSSRLHSTWLSQECEVRAGPEYIIRKYMFFNNGTFLLWRYHYAEESCSIATHTVAIRGFIKLLGSSTVVSGATETNFHVDAVNIIPLNRQVAHKFGHKLNLVCGPQPRWRPYVPELIYEQPRQDSPFWQGPVYNSLQAYSPAKKRLGLQCLEPFGIEFSELKLLRVQKKQLGPPGDTLYSGPRYQLFLASPAPNVHSRWNHKPTSLQPTAMLRSDTVNGCPICGSVIRATEYSPPLLHEVAALPALIGGYWHSDRCESSQGGIWLKRQLQIHSGDKLWTGQWDYYDDPQCTIPLYAVTAAGSYVQRAGRQRRHEETDEQTFLDYFRNVNASRRLLFKRSVSDNAARITRSGLYRNNLYAASRLSKRVAVRGKRAKRQKKRSLSDNVYQILHDAKSSTIQSRFAAMLRGHQAYDATTKKPSSNWIAPSGTTELDLHIAESILIPGDVMPTRCGADRPGAPLINWSRNCIPRAIEAPSTLGLRAKLSVNWTGQYILLLGSRDDNMWDAPLRQCAQISPHNSVLQAHLRRSVGLRFGLLSVATTSRISGWLLLSQVLLWCAYYLAR
ncbi:hypothetical protein DMN91_003928 [Ooceraea biroi]|uniref:Protein APCDD1 n=1 Tax=Ooceraea biroi TaxID=2015173 RepID=A0A026X2C8_OOCBI|nr:protein APCDD1 [Ooceraea biroi]EZA62470.1 Protein APCDD1 [Ooceraea biroi]RLU23722.1 hypothetical protein DMN91_003928 [Ooceraea biroi]